MNSSTAIQPVIVHENGGTVIKAFGDPITFKLTAAQTGGAFSVGLAEVPPGGGPPLHCHANEDEVFLVQEGRIEYFIHDRWIELGPGGVVLAPRNIPHCFRNSGTTTARQWTLFTPSGFETFFDRCATEFARPGGPDTGRLVAIAGEHGIQFVKPAA